MNTIFVLGLNTLESEETTPREEMLNSEIPQDVLMVETENMKDEPFVSNNELKVSYGCTEKHANLEFPLNFSYVWF